MNEAGAYQRIGEFVVCYEWLVTKVREIGCLITDPERKQWPPMAFRKHRDEELFDEVSKLFIDALPKCRLEAELEADFRNSLQTALKDLHHVRRSKNRILHSAFVEFKAGGEVQEIVRFDNRPRKDPTTGEMWFENESLSPRNHFTMKWP